MSAIARLSPEKRAKLKRVIFQEYERRKQQRAKKGLAEDRLRDFVELFWPFVEPARPLIPGWPLDAICEHLEAVTAGQIKRLVIGVPPGFMKSLTANVFFPAWEWGPKRMPSLRYIAASYSEALTIRDNVRFRNIIMSDLYRQLWGDVFSPAKGQFNIRKVANDHTGWKLATSVSGVGTGERGDRFVIDDGNSVKEAESEAVLASTTQWFTEVVPTRLNSAEDGVIINIQQRTSDLDITGEILRRELDYVHLTIPMEYDSRRHCVTCIGWQDPRGLDDAGQPLEAGDLDAAENALAWPERFPRHSVEDLKATMGPYAVSGQFQQDPAPRGGGIFKEEWFKHWPPDDWPEPPPGVPVQFPAMDYVVAALDTAFTTREENDYSACAVFGVWRSSESKKWIPPRLVTDELGALRIEEENYNKIMSMYAWQKRLEMHGSPEDRPPGLTDQEWNRGYWLEERKKKWGLVEWVVWTCRHFHVDTLLIEDKAAGHSVAQELQRLYAREDWSVQLVTPDGDKVARAYSVQPLVSNGVVYVPLFVDGGRRAWADLLIDNLKRFPKGAHDDLSDAAIYGLRHLRNTGLAMRRDESEMVFEEENRYKSRGTALYDV